MAEGDKGEEVARAEDDGGAVEGGAGERRCRALCHRRDAVERAGERCAGERGDGEHDADRAVAAPGVMPVVDPQHLPNKERKRLGGVRAPRERNWWAVRAHLARWRRPRRHNRGGGGGHRNSACGARHGASQAAVRACRKVVAWADIALAQVGHLKAI